MENVQRILLNTTKSASQRYSMLFDNDEWVVVCGVNRGNGYQAYYAPNYALMLDYIPDGVKLNIRRVLDNITKCA